MTNDHSDLGISMDLITLNSTLEEDPNLSSKKLNPHAMESIQVYLPYLNPNSFYANVSFASFISVLTTVEAEEDWSPEAMEITVKVLNTIQTIEIPRTFDLHLTEDSDILNGHLDPWHKLSPSKSRSKNQAKQILRLQVGW